MASIIDFNPNNSMAEICREIIITGERLVKDIQKEFNLIYPYLKVEFLKNDATNTLLSGKIDKIEPETSIAQFANIASGGKISLENNRTINDLENDFRNLLGVTIQVLRKSGKVWNIISLTDAWTLESQNKAGEFISSEMKS